MDWDGITERRQHRRAKIRMMLQFQDPTSADGDEPARMETLDFSAGGFYCRINRHIEALTRLGLRLVFPPFGSDHPTERLIDCEAVVVRSERDETQEGHYMMAAHFTRLSPGDRGYLDDYIRWYDEVFEPVENDREDEAGKGKAQAA